MKIVKIKVSVSTRYVGSEVSDELELEVEDYATDEEIEEIKNEATKEWMFDEIEWGWVDVQ